MNCHYTYFCPQCLGVGLFKIYRWPLEADRNISEANSCKISEQTVRDTQHGFFYLNLSALFSVFCDVYIKLCLYIFFPLFQTSQCVECVPIIEWIWPLEWREGVADSSCAYKVVLHSQGKGFESQL